MELASAVALEYTACISRAKSQPNFCPQNSSQLPVLRQAARIPQRRGIYARDRCPVDYLQGFREYKRAKHVATANAQCVSKATFLTGTSTRFPFSVYGTSWTCTICRMPARTPGPDVNAVDKTMSEKTKKKDSPAQAHDAHFAERELRSECSSQVHSSK